MYFLIITYKIRNQWQLLMMCHIIFSKYMLSHKHMLSHIFQNICYHINFCLSRMIFVDDNQGTSTFFVYDFLWSWPLSFSSVSILFCSLILLWWCFQRKWLGELWYFDICRNDSTRNQSLCLRSSINELSVSLIFDKCPHQKLISIIKHVNAHQKLLYQSSRVFVLSQSRGQSVAQQSLKRTPNEGSNILEKRRK